MERDSRPSTAHGCLVFVCRCGPNLAGHLDLDGLGAALREAPQVASVAFHDTLCTPQGQEFLVQSLRDSGCLRFAVVGCSAREHEGTFREACRKAGLNPYLFAMANVREQCAWVCADQAAATRKAIALARAAIARAANLQPLAEREVECCTDALVLGSGVAGLTAAKALAEAGRKVVLVEREESAGGRVAVLADLFPDLECASCMLDPLIDDVLHHPQVEFLPLSEVVELVGRRGAFSARIRRRPRRVDPAGCYGCGTCLEACPVEGASKIDPGVLQKAIHFAYTGAVPHVPYVDPETCLHVVGDGSCTACASACPFGNVRLDEQETFEERRIGAVVVATGDEPMPRDASLPRSVVTAYELERLLNQAGPTQGAVRVPSTGAEPRTIALLRCADAKGTGPIAECSGLCCSSFDKFVAMLRKHLPEARLFDLGAERRRPGRALPADEHLLPILLGPAGGFRVEAAEGGAVRIEYQAASGPGRLEVDLAVVAPPLVGSAGTRAAARALRLEVGASGFVVPEHARLRPFATLAEGVFVAGCAQGSKSVPEAATQGAAAAGAVLSTLVPGRMLRLDPLCAQVDPERCGACGVCASGCPYQALSRQAETGRYAVDENLCRGCGCCAASCPSAAIRAPHFEAAQIRAEVAALLE
ncbi:MAG TPA: 4Fe-4S dicluster domain-containing protein [Myxococcales bacterium]|jgi:heterodisulfide reductase subunit A